MNYNVYSMASNGTSNMALNDDTIYYTRFNHGSDVNQYKGANEMKKYLVVSSVVLALGACATTGGGVPTSETLTQLVTATCNANIPGLFIEAAKLEAGPGATLQYIAQLACRIFSDPNKSQRASVRAVTRRLSRA